MVALTDLLAVWHFLHNWLFLLSFCLWFYCCRVNQPGKWCWVLVLAAASLAACLGKPRVCFEKQAKWKRGGASRPPFYCFVSVWNGRDLQPGTTKTQEPHICSKSRGNTVLQWAERREIGSILTDSRSEPGVFHRFTAPRGACKERNSPLQVANLVYRRPVL